eukprot:8531211-Lingulodinium_polyedra.AAC.1
MRGVANHCIGQPSLEVKDGRRVANREVENFRRWQPMDVDCGHGELHVLENLVQSKHRLLRGECGCWLSGARGRFTQLWAQGI